MKRQLDSQDSRLVAELAKDGQQSAGKLSEKLGVTSPTVRSRMKSLIADGVLKIAGMVNPFKTKGLTIALVGLTVAAHNKMDAKLDEISKLEKVNWAAVVTGRYDILAEIVLTDGIDDLYHFINEELSQVGDINTSESFVVMKARRKWVMLPDAVANKLA